MTSLSCPKIGLRSEYFSLHPLGVVFDESWARFQVETSLIFLGGV